MQIKNKYLLYFTLLYFIGSVCGKCQEIDDKILFTKHDSTKTYTEIEIKDRSNPQRRSLSVKAEENTTPQSEKATSPHKDPENDKRITIQEVFDKFFSKNTFIDKCISKHNQDFWKFKSSNNTIKANPKEKSTFTRNYIKGEKGQHNYTATGTYDMSSGKSYISWSASGGIPGHKVHKQAEGQIYILDIQNVKDKDTNIKSLITYYSCFEGTDFMNDNIYISQTGKSYDSSTEVTAEEALEKAKAVLNQHKGMNTKPIIDMKAWEIECYPTK